MLQMRVPVLQICYQSFTDLQTDPPEVGQTCIWVQKPQTACWLKTHMVADFLSTLHSGKAFSSGQNSEKSLTPSWWKGGSLPPPKYLTHLGSGCSSSGLLLATTTLFLKNFSTFAGLLLSNLKLVTYSILITFIFGQSLIIVNLSLLETLMR